MNKSEQIGQLAKALAVAQSKIKGAAKDTSNPFFKSKYADLSSVWDACRDALTENGLCVIQTLGSTDIGVTVTTTLAHSSGEWISGELHLKPKDFTPQAIGSAITYARRYGLAAIAGVAPEDDDGEAAQGREAQKTKTPLKAVEDFGKPSADDLRNLRIAGNKKGWTNEGITAYYKAAFKVESSKDLNNQQFYQLRSVVETTTFVIAMNELTMAATGDVK